ncbi:MAG: D-amino acid aminotransferase [Candidatus Sumerlaeaceae bacterium]|nr:D-amino acid aminotransferase [Candidatus Sumerlaeaceae bacterium]
MAYVNGRFLPLADAKTSVEDRAYQFADGVYEVVKFYGRNAVRLEPHLVRLMESSAHLRIAGGPGLDEWKTIIEQLATENELVDDETNEYILYQQVSRGVAPRNHLFPKDAIEPSVVAYFRKAPVYSREQRETGIALSLQPDERWNRCYIKSVCLLPAVMAKQAAADAGCFEALLVRNGIVTEGSATNTYCVREGIVYTHPTGPHILTGVTRTLVFEAAEKAGVEIREEAVTPDQFAAADEAFISSTTMGIMPATRLDGKPVGKSGKPGPVTRQLAQALDAIVASELRGHEVTAK